MCSICRRISLNGAQILPYKRRLFCSLRFYVLSLYGRSVTFATSLFALDATFPETKLAVMATTLLLVPGYPLMNAFWMSLRLIWKLECLDLQHAAVLTMAAATGLLGAMSLTTWLYNV